MYLCFFPHRAGTDLWELTFYSKGSQFVKVLGSVIFLILNLIYEFWCVNMCLHLFFSPEHGWYWGLICNTVGYIFVSSIFLEVHGSVIFMNKDCHISCEKWIHSWTIRNFNYSILLSSFYLVVVTSSSQMNIFFPTFTCHQLSDFNLYW